MDSRLCVFPSLPAGDKYELLLFGDEHSAFGRPPAARRPHAAQPQPPSRGAGAVGFRDAYLRGDEEARAWLRGPGPRSVLAERDRWQLKQGPAPTLQAASDPPA